MHTKQLHHALALLLLAASGLACGGAGPADKPPVSTTTVALATGFDYTDPSTAGWRLIKNPASTSTHLVLDLVGPAGQMARGVGFNLTSDGSVKFHKFESGSYIKDTGVFQLKLTAPNSYTTTYPDYFEPVLLVGGTKSGGKLLTVGIYQKDRTQLAQAVDQPLLQIGIDFDSATAPGTGAPIPLQVIRARIIPDDIGTVPADGSSDWSSVIQKFRMEDIELAVGTLQAR